jgi:hypothetical protein
MNLNSFSALLENCRRKAWADRRGRIAMLGLVEGEGVLSLEEVTTMRKG